MDFQQVHVPSTAREEIGNSSEAGAKGGAAGCTSPYMYMLALFIFLLTPIYILLFAIQFGEPADCSLPLYSSALYCLDSRFRSCHAYVWWYSSPSETADITFCFPDVQCIEYF
jgi:hypothetical protein